MPLIGLLGRFFLRIDERDGGRLSKKGQGLIAYLALNRGAPIGRERLADLLWPEHDSDHARHSLRNCLLQLRSGLGPGTEAWLVADGDGLRLEPGAVDVDVDRFLTLARSDALADLAAAAQLYRGELLADLAVNSDPFEAWVGPERARMLAAACQVQERLATAQEAAGQTEAAIASARRLVALERFSEEGHRLLMRLYAQSGRRAAAISQYRTFVALLREELGVGPDAETEALAKRIQSAESAGRGPSKLGPAPTAAGEQRPDRSVALAPVQAPLVRAFAAVDDDAELAWPSPPSLEIGVVPVRNLTGDTNKDLLAEGLTEDLITDLTQAGGSLAISHVVPPDREGADGSILIRRSGARYLITGSLQPALAGYRINIRLLDGETGRYLWANRIEGGLADLQEKYSAIIADIVRELHLLLFREVGRRALPDHARGFDATELQQQGSALLVGTYTASRVREAQMLFMQSLALEASNIEALTGVALTYQLLQSQPWWSRSIGPREAFDLGSHAVAAALVKDPRHARANMYHAFLLSGAGRLDDAAGALAKALEVDPGRPAPLGFRGYNLAFMGRAEEGFPDIQAAIEGAMSTPQNRDRSISIFSFYAGMGQLLLGRVDDALNFLHRSLEMNPSYGSARIWSAAAEAMKGGSDAGAAAIMEFRQRWPTYRLRAFEHQWVSRSNVPEYRKQVQAVFTCLRQLGLPD